VLRTGIAFVKNGAPDEKLCYNDLITTKENKVSQEDYGDLPIEDFTHGLYQNVKSIKVALWLIFAAEFGKYFLW
jgi:hypothetical protein